MYPERSPEATSYLCILGPSQMIILFKLLRGHFLFLSKIAPNTIEIYYNGLSLEFLNNLLFVCLRRYIGVFAKLGKAIISFVMTVCPPALEGTSRNLILLDLSKTCR